MKYGRCKWLYSSLLLVARDAARRFTFGHGIAARSRGSWVPMVLQWRQRRRQQKLMTRCAAATKPILWFPQFHFHYATHVSNQPLRSRSVKSTPAAGGPGTRIMLDHRWTTVRAAELRHQTHPHSRPLISSYVNEVFRPKDAGASTSSKGLQHPGDAPAIAPQVTRRPVALQFGKAARVNPKGKIEERTQYFQTHSRTWHNWLQILRVRQSTLADHLPHHSIPSNSRRVTFNDPEDLVWRRPKRPAPETPQVESGQLSFDSVARPAVRSFQSQDVVSPSPPTERATVLPITSLDPSFVDRLTEDVIRRVQQRALIERQRRGL